MIGNKLAVIVSKFVIFLVAGVGAELSVGIFSGLHGLHTLSFFTVLSGCVIAIYYLLDGIYLARVAARGEELPVALCPTVKHLVLFASLLTGAVANTLLVGVDGPTGAADVASGELLHKVTPVLVLIDFALFEPHGHFSAKDPLVSTLFPLAYFICIMVGVNCLGLDANSFDASTSYPYPFIDPEVCGVGGVVVAACGIAVAFIAVGYLVFGLDRLLARWSSRK